MEAIGSAVPSPLSKLLATTIALLGVGLAAALAAWGTYGEDNPSTRDYLIVLAIIGVAALVVFGWIVPRALTRSSPGATAIVLAVLAVLTIGVMWTGLPPVLAAGAAVIGIAGWDAPTRPWLCRAAVVIALFAVVGDIAVYVGDMA
jgi:hypothetical protein